jgi:hypothetical protein
MSSSMQVGIKSYFIFGDGDRNRCDRNCHSRCLLLGSRIFTVRVHRRPPIMGTSLSRMIVGRESRRIALSALGGRAPCVN